MHALKLKVHTDLMLLGIGLVSCNDAGSLPSGLLTICKDDSCYVTHVQERKHARDIYVQDIKTLKLEANVVYFIKYIY